MHADITPDESVESQRKYKCSNDGKAAENSTDLPTTKGKKSFQMFPTDIPSEQPTLVVLSFDEAMTLSKQDFKMEVHLINLGLANGTTKITATYMNPFTCYFMAPEGVSGLVTVRVYENDVHLGSKTLRYQSQQSERTAKIMSVYNQQIRTLSDRLLEAGVLSTDLDQILSNDFISDDADNQIFLFQPYRYLSQDVQDFKPRKEDFPTVLHLAASYGLSEMCSLLTDLPDAYHAFCFSRSKDEFPDKISGKNGHSELAEMLQIFGELSEDLVSMNPSCHLSQVSERSLAMHQLLYMCRRQGIISAFYEPLMPDDCDLYENSGGDSGTYTSLRGRGSEANDSSVKSNQYSVLERNSAIGEIGEQLVQNADEVDPNAAFLEVRKNVVMETFLPEHEGCSYSTGQMELLELMNKVKREELSIDNAELLFKEWKLRYNNRRSRFKQSQLTLKCARNPSSNSPQPQMKPGFFERLINRLRHLKAEKKEPVSCPAAAKISTDQTEDRLELSSSSEWREEGEEKGDIYYRPNGLEGGGKTFKGPSESSSERNEVNDAAGVQLLRQTSKDCCHDTTGASPTPKNRRRSRSFGEKASYNCPDLWRSSGGEDDDDDDDEGEKLDAPELYVCMELRKHLPTNPGTPIIINERDGALPSASTRNADADRKCPNPKNLKGFWPNRQLQKWASSPNTDAPNA